MNRFVCRPEARGARGRTNEGGKGRAPSPGENETYRCATKRKQWKMDHVQVSLLSRLLLLQLASSWQWAAARIIIDDVLPTVPSKVLISAAGTAGRDTTVSGIYGGGSEMLVGGSPAFSLPEPVPYPTILVIHVSWCGLAPVASPEVRLSAGQALTVIITHRYPDCPPPTCFLYIYIYCIHIPEYIRYIYVCVFPYGESGQTMSTLPQPLSTYPLPPRPHPPTHTPIATPLLLPPSHHSPHPYTSLLPCPPHPLSSRPPSPPSPTSHGGRD